MGPAFSETSIKSKELLHMRSISAKRGVLTVGDRFNVGLKIATGSFGVVKLGKSIQSGDDVIIKMEPINAQVPSLLLEYKFYSMLQVENGKHSNPCDVF